MEGKKIAGLGLLAALVVGVIYIITQQPPEPTGEPEIDMALTLKEVVQNANQS